MSVTLPMGFPTVPIDWPSSPAAAARPRPASPARPWPPAASPSSQNFHEIQLAKFYNVLQNVCNFLAGSFSAVSKRNFARNYAFDSSFQALQDFHTFAPLQSQDFSKKSV